MTAAFLSRVGLRADVPAAALAPILLPGEPGARTGSAHRLVWSLFAGEDERRFLWREQGAGGLVPGRTRFLVLSAVRPADPHGLFDLESKPFAPELAQGDLLGFSLRANPVVARSREGRRNSAHCDVVMDALKDVAAGGRAEARRAVIGSAGRSWLEKQGERHGFALDDRSPLRIDGYDRLRIPRRSGKAMTISTLDFDGALRVSDPERFVGSLCAGFGKARGFGCGLMLIRRI
ncbi:MAG: type I-E CRISPR-associated protein Cas6/Cse3/CasE [Geminicoccaceae bacterium]|nr:type I-E CRISPR-associated protein Cas6/Cse3/CasE [Geminicoccaceae bacterium]